MNFLKRNVRATEPAVAKEPQRIVHREIEISMEREWISVTARNHSEESAQADVNGERKPESKLAVRLRCV